jgi:hypothetical protein
MEEIRRQRLLLKQQETALKAKEKTIAKHQKASDKIAEMLKANPIGFILWNYSHQFHLKEMFDCLEKQKENYEIDSENKYNANQFLEDLKEWFDDAAIGCWIEYSKTAQSREGGRAIGVDFDLLKEIILVFELSSLIDSEEDLLNAWRKKVGIEVRSCNICFEDQYCVNGFYKKILDNEPISQANCGRSCACKVDVCINCVKKLQNKCPTCRSKFEAWGK